MNMKPNILFVNLPSIPFNEIQKIVNKQSDFTDFIQPISFPMGLLYISSYMKKNVDVGKVCIVDFVLLLENLIHYQTLESFINSTIEKEVNFTPDIIGISLIFSTSHRFFETIVLILKKYWPNVKVVVGGTHATNCFKAILNCDAVDYIIRGEGEIAFSSLIENIVSGNSNSIRGVYTRNSLSDDVFFKTSLIPNLDKLPLPDWELLDTEKYITSRGRQRVNVDEAQKRIGTIITTRGCPFKCTFCSAHTVHGRKVRSRSLSNIIHEIKLLHERYGVNLFIPEDDLFTFKKDRVIGVLRAVTQLNIPDVEFQFPNGLSIATLDKEILCALKNVGVRTITLAIESGSDYVQKKIMKKRCSLTKAKEIVRLSRELGFIVRCYFILGFPGETKQHIEITKNYILNLKADWYVIHPVVPLVGSELYQQFLERGDIQDNHLVWEQSSFRERSFDTIEISGADLKKICYQLNIELNFINNYNLKNQNFNRAKEQFLDIINLYPFHIFALQGLYKCYVGLGDKLKAKSTLDILRDTIKNDKRAKNMFTQYKQLFNPEFLQYIFPDKKNLNNKDFE